MFAIYEIWNAGASVPGGSIKSRHETMDEAAAALASYEDAERQRQATPPMSIREADAIIKATYGYLLDGEPLGEARSKLRTKANHKYKIIEVA